MTDTTTLAIVAAIPPTLAALGSLVVAIIAAARSKKNGEKVDEVKAQAAQIVHSTNGTLSRLESLNTVLTSRIEGLEQALAVSRAGGIEAASVAAQSAQDVQTALLMVPVLPTTVEPETAKE